MSMSGESPFKKPLGLLSLLLILIFLVCAYVFADFLRDMYKVMFDR